MRAGQLTAAARVMREGRETEALERSKDDLPKPLMGVRILVVEDDCDSLDALGLLLQFNGAEVHCASSAIAGRKVLDRVRPHVLISDLSMPGEDGFAFLASVRALAPERGGNVPALAFSAMSAVGSRLRALKAGFQVFLRKPDDVPLIVPAVVRLLPPSLAP
jgi:CheY-like chemotaxis protein